MTRGLLIAPTILLANLLTSATALAQAPAPLPAQGKESPRPRFGIVAGLNLATLDFDGGTVGQEVEEVIGTRTGFAAGAVAVYPVGRDLALRTGLHWSQKGAEYDLSELGAAADASTELTYLELPLLISLQIPTSGGARPFVAIGGKAGLLLSAKAEFDGESQDIDDELAPFDFGLAVAAGVEFPLGGRSAGTVEAHYTYGLVNIDDRPGDDVSAKNRVFSILGGVLF